jgi:hypothetical protein
MFIGGSATDLDQSVVIGTNAGAALTDSNDVVFIGYAAGDGGN